MAEFNPRVGQVNDPDLEAALNRLLTIVGPLGRLNVLDTVIPIVSLGNVVDPTIQVEQPSFTVGQFFTAGIITAPAAGAVLADTGQLPAGVYDVVVTLANSENSSVHNAFIVAHRNAADTADLSTWNFATIGGQLVSAYAKVLALNERIRVTAQIAGSASRKYTANIFAAVRG